MDKKIALIGNPNSGKTTFFNKVTGAYEYTGNRSGVTVKESMRKIKGTDLVLCDLPGIYSLFGYSREEKIALDFLTQSKPCGIINIVDGTNLNRGLYLTIQLLKLNLPVLLVINMKDECEKNKIKINTGGLSEELGIEVLFISAKNSDDIWRVINDSENIKRANIKDFDRLNKKLLLLEDKMEYEDKKIKKANSIYSYIDTLCEQFVSDDGDRLRLTGMADKILSSKYLGVPIMIGVLLLGFYLAFGTPGMMLSSLFREVFSRCIAAPLEYIASFSHVYIKELVTEGVLKGMEAVVSFLPFILVLFAYTTWLEDFGYMSRIAYISDNIMRRAGLSGLSVIPLLLGFGCSTPAMMSARIIPDAAERNRTVIAVPFISCSAKIPVYALLSGLFFKNRYGLVILFLYSLGIISAVATAMLLRGKNENASGSLIELPSYRFPEIKKLFRSVCEKLKDFLIRTGTVIVALSVIVWFFSNFDFTLSKTTVELSMLGKAGKLISPLFNPLGFGNVGASVSLLSGLAAKEGIVSSLGILCGGVEKIPALFTEKSALSYLVFVSLYPPCVSSFATLAREVTKKRWVFVSFILHILFAYGAAFVVYNI